MMNLGFWGKRRSVIIARDSFDRVDSNTTLGMTDTGQPWTAASGTWGIDSGQAYIVSATGPSQVDRALIDPGASDFYLSCEFSVVDALQRVLFRHVDADNEWFVNINNPQSAYQLVKRVGGETTAMATFATTPQNGDRIEIVARGDVIRLYIRGAVRATVTDGEFQNATKVGLACSNRTTPRWDDLRLEAIA